MKLKQVVLIIGLLLVVFFGSEAVENNDNKIAPAQSTDKKIIEDFLTFNPHLKGKKLSVAYDSNGTPHVLVSDF